MRSRILFLALSVFVLATSAVAAQKSRRSNPKQSNPPSSVVVREPRGPSDHLQKFRALLTATKFTLLTYGDGMAPPIP